MSVPYDMKRQTATYKFQGTPEQAQNIIKVAEEEFERYKGRLVAVNSSEVHTADGDFGDHNFDPPFLLTVLDLEIVEEDWLYTGLLPCWVVSPPDDSTTDTFYVYGREINLDGSRGEWEASYWSPASTSPDVE